MDNDNEITPFWSFNTMIIGAAVLSMPFWFFAGYGVWKFFS
jgi:hypothetical protein